MAQSELLFWHGRPYLIDHGSALTFHHTWASPQASAERPYNAGDHVLIGSAPDVDAADATLTPRFTDHLVAAGCADVPDEWLAGEPGFAGPEDVRRGYRNWFRARLAARPMWVPALRDGVAAGPRPRTPRQRHWQSWLGDAQ